VTAVVVDRVDVYVLGGGSGILASFSAECATCPWSVGAFAGGGGGSPTPWVSDAEAREQAQRWADRHNAEHHSDEVLR
jgi:hypothetical protein